MRSYVHMRNALQSIIRWYGFEVQWHLWSLYPLSYSDQSTKDSARILWLLLGIICQNNGLVKGSARINQAQNNDLITVEIAKMLCANNGGKTPPSTGARGFGFSDETSAQHPPLAVNPEVMNELQLLVATGQKMAACNIAVEHRLWDHALILSKKIGEGVYNDVLVKFAESVIASSSTTPLASLYSLYAGTPPTFDNNTTSLSYPCDDNNNNKNNGNDNVDNWAEMLAMLISNPTPGSINTILNLGDSLRKQASFYPCGNLLFFLYFFVWFTHEVFLSTFPIVLFFLSFF